MRRRAGITIMELLVASAVSVVVVAATSQAYVAGMKTSGSMQDSRSRAETRLKFQDRITKLLRGAYVSSTATDTLTYFEGTNSAGTGSSGGNSDADTLVFTTVGQRLSGAVLNADQTDDFETLNSQFGPQGGVTEISLSMTPVGSPPQPVTGVIIREEHPADGDPTQGGTESVFDPDVTSMTFEFYDGTAWDPTWNTSTGPRRIPAAVQVTYQLKDEDTQRVFIVRLPGSDVTALNPVQQVTTTP